MDGLTIPLPYEYSKFLFYSSFSMLIATIISCIMNDIYITAYFLVIFITSINYWRQPEYGLRRDIDLFMVKFGICVLLWQLFLLKSEFSRYCLLSFMICGLFFYFCKSETIWASGRFQSLPKNPGTGSCLNSSFRKRISK